MVFCGIGVLDGASISWRWEIGNATDDIHGMEQSIEINHSVQLFLGVDSVFLDRNKITNSTLSVYSDPERSF